MCGLRTRSRADVDPPRFLDRTAIGGWAYRPRGDALFSFMPFYSACLITRWQLSVLLFPQGPCDQRNSCLKWRFIALRISGGLSVRTKKKATEIESLGKSLDALSRIILCLLLCLANVLSLACSNTFLPARRYASYGPVSVSVCVCRKSVFYRKGKGMNRLIRFLARRLLSASRSLCYKEIQVSTRGFFQNSGTFS